MAFLQIQFFSAALNVASTVNVIMPEANQGIGVGASFAELPSEDGERVFMVYFTGSYSDIARLPQARPSAVRSVPPAWSRRNSADIQARPGTANRPGEDHPKGLARL